MFLCVLVCWMNARKWARHITAIALLSNCYDIIHHEKGKAKINKFATETSTISKYLSVERSSTNFLTISIGTKRFQNPKDYWHNVNARESFQLIIIYILFSLFEIWYNQIHEFYNDRLDMYMYNNNKSSNKGFIVAKSNFVLWIIIFWG